MRSSPLHSILAFTLAGLSSEAAAQQIVGFQITEASCDTLHAEISVFFPFGAGDACPALSGTSIWPGDATNFISLYYDISGVWPQVGCTTTTTLAIPLPDGNVMVNLATFNINEGDTSVLVADTVLNVCTTSIPVVPSPLTGFWVQNDLLQWPPARFPDGSRIRIVSSGGQLVRSAITKAGQCWLGDLPPGIYTAWCTGSRGTAFRFARR